ncbi:DUF4136 domain-containing protein [Sphingomonas sp. CJ20]
MTTPFRLAPLLLATGAAALLAGCTTGNRAGPIDVTRYHLGQPMERTTVAIEPMSGATQISPEYQTYADAVKAELERLGYVASRSDMPAGYIAAVSFVRVPQGSFKEPPPVSIGLGGGSFGGGRRGGGVGLGGGVSFGIGGKTREIYGTELWVQLRRRADNSTIWEGRARTQAVGGTEGSQPIDTAARLARALFKDFPGESGITITVK